ncbi:MAG: hypothetical protein NTW80_01270 [Deltaproteobacteria bacterium]|nr:hypothetical protein [Deltaproteobacteria bacterium]
MTVGATVMGLSRSKINPDTGPYARMAARAAMISSESADLRFRIDGGQPSAGDGHYLVSGDTLVLSGTQALQQLQAIRTGDVSATLRVTYFY